MTVRTYRSTDASAPTLSGSNGALITVLDAVLVNGYGSQTAAGWTKPFSGTNKAVYRMNTSGNTGFYLNVQDNGPGAGAAKEARVWGYEVATAQDVGTGQFPNTSQLATGIIIRKSTTADATARAWTIVADGSVFYMFLETGDLTQPTMGYAFAFGDFFSYKPSDPYRCIIIGRNLENTGGGGQEALSGLFSLNVTVLATTMIGHYIARHWTGVGGSCRCGHIFDQSKGTVGGSTNAQLADNGTQGNTGNIGLIGNYLSNGITFPYPNGPDGGLFMSPIWLNHHSAIRGYLKGLWAPLHHRPLNHNDTFSGTGNLAGKSFVVQDILGSGNGGQSFAGQIMIETSDTWS